MYTLEQAEQLAADFLRDKYADSECEVALYKEDTYRAQKGECYYFAWQSADYIATGDDKYFLYGTPHIEVHSVTGACRFLSIHECFSIDPFTPRQ